MARKSNKVLGSTLSENKSKSPNPFAESLSFKHDAIKYVSLYEHRFDEREVTAICRHMIEWVANPIRTKMNYKIIQFLMSEGISWDTCYTLKRNFPMFQRTYEFVLQTLGNHREWMGLTKEWDPAMVKFTMPIYDKEWNEETIRLAKLKALENLDEGFKVLKIPVYIERDADEEKPATPPDTSIL